MAYIPKDTWTTVEMEELGNVVARSLDRDERLADVAVEVRAAVAVLAAAASGAQAAREEVQYYRLARAAVFVRLKDAKAADAFFPDLYRSGGGVAATPAVVTAQVPGTVGTVQAA